MNLWKRNAVVTAIVLFVGAAVYLNWSYSQEGMNVSSELEGGKILGEAALVSTGNDPLLNTGYLTVGGEPTPQGETEEEPTTVSSAYFDSARLNRQEARDSALSLLQEAVGDAKADQATIQMANESIQTMAAYTLSEANIENLVMAKGYAQCVAFLSDNSISVVVSTNGVGLTEVDTAKISEIITQETGFSTSQVKIIETQ